MMTARFRATLLTLILASSLAETAFAASVVLAWDPSPDTDISTYLIQYGVTSGSYASVISAGNVTSFQVDGLVAGQSYYFIVEACDTAGIYSAPSNELLVVAPSSIAPPTI